jgi:hypothetical protein
VHILIRGKDSLFDSKKVQGIYYEYLNMDKDLFLYFRMRNIRKIKQEINGRSFTAQRQLLLDLLKKAGGHLSAKELYRGASTKNESVSLATVYRTLQLFKELGLVEERRLG